jgi:hypothetical protein
MGDPLAPRFAPRACYGECSGLTPALQDPSPSAVGEVIDLVLRERFNLVWPTTDAYKHPSFTGVGQHPSLRVSGYLVRLGRSARASRCLSIRPCLNRRQGAALKRAAGKEAPGTLLQLAQGPRLAPSRSPRHRPKYISPVPSGHPDEGCPPTGALPTHEAG